jgi:transcriptional regulator with XRE-family HTH domain
MPCNSIPTNRTDLVSNSKLKSAREAAGLSQSQLAKKAGVSVRTLQEYEQGRKPISKAAAEKVVRIAQAVGKTVEELI